ncbi:nucleopolyhedrovirus P10 family protein [Streptomyces sp. NPDC046915]|uniref:nucleopolyhedrovirus P10 family protein n=1 Tax=Streptomyces sp. NPDC046915 TaxID=3155257 RepID=UPI0033C24EDC
MTAERWARAVRQQLGLGRLLPLGGARDGAWIAEGAAAEVLRRATREVTDVRLGALRLGLARPEDTEEPVVPLPPSALPPGPLRLTADFAAAADMPLPDTASRLRLVLAAAATEGLGLAVAEVDLRVTGLLDDEEPSVPATETVPSVPARETADADETRAAEAALAVPGVTRLTGALGGLGRAVRIEERRAEDEADATLAHRHVRVEVAVDAAYRALDVARRVRAAVGDALRDHPTVAVLVTAVD